MKKILILNGAGRKNGSTSALVNAFAEGAKASGNEIHEFFLHKMDIHGCMNCQGCGRESADFKNPCVQKDDMAQIYEAFLWCDIIVFASPVYWFSITGQLKTAVDRLYAMHRRYGVPNVIKPTVMLLTAGAPVFDQPMAWYSHFEKYCNWPNLGTVLGADKIDEARALGESIN